MSKTFEQIVQDVAATVRAETGAAMAARNSVTWAFIRSRVHAALDRNGSEVASVELVDRLVDAVRAELAAEETAPVGPAAEVAVSITGLRGSRGVVAAELRNLAAQVESGALYTQSANGCDVSVKRAWEPVSGPREAIPNVDRYSRGAVWERNGERLTVLCSGIVLGMPYVHFMGDTLRGSPRENMTELNGWRYIGKEGA